MIDYVTGTDERVPIKIEGTFYDENQNEVSWKSLVNPVLVLDGKSDKGGYELTIECDVLTIDGEGFFLGLADVSWPITSTYIFKCKITSTTDTIACDETLTINVS